MKYIKRRIILTLFLVAVLSVNDIKAQNRNEQKKVKFRYLVGLYNHKAAEEVRQYTFVQAKLLEFRLYSSRKHLEDSLNAQLVSKTGYYKTNMILMDTIKWDLSNGLPHYPEIMRRHRKTDYDISKDQEASEWIIYMMILDHWKEYKKLPYQIIDGFSVVDTLQFNNSQKYLLKGQFSYDANGERTYKDSVIRIE
ncbi:hypothetical protein [Reichenbachiella sp.]|uniref:hypothetical protein n=1 Tax=Reichenbachiella sp. TaxID=2184521 RepID=UPI003BAF4148